MKKLKNDMQRNTYFLSESTFNYLTGKREQAKCLICLSPLSWNRKATTVRPFFTVSTVTARSLFSFSSAMAGIIDYFLSPLKVYFNESLRER